MNMWQALASVFDIVFDFWPVFIVSPIARRGNPFRSMFFSWLFWAAVRVMLVFNPEPVRASLLIPEPWNTVLFFVTGVVLGGIMVGQSFLKRKALQRKADQLRGREDLLNLSPVEFEEMVVEWFKILGYNAKRTGRSGDHGVDVVATKNGAKWIVQCKRWRKPVGENIVRDFYGTLQHEKAVEGAIIAVSGFSRPAREWAKGKPIRLINGEEFLKRWRSAKRRQTQQKHR